MYFSNNCLLFSCTASTISLSTFTSTWVAFFWVACSFTQVPKLCTFTGSVCLAAWRCSRRCPICGCWPAGETAPPAGSCRPSTVWASAPPRPSQSYPSAPATTWHAPLTGAGWVGRRQGGREAGRQGGREAGRQGGSEAGRQGSVGRWVGGSVGRWVGGWVGGWAGGRMDRQMDRRTDGRLRELIN